MGPTKQDAHRILDNIKIDPETSCWEWQKHKNRKGYGKIRAFRKTLSAHRLSYTLFTRADRTTDIPEGAVIMHDCDNPGCVNPTHLTAGTQLDNVADMVAKGRQATGQRHGSFKPGKQAVWLMCFLLGQGRTHEQVAEELGMSVAVVIRETTRGFTGP